MLQHRMIATINHSIHERSISIREDPCSMITSLLEVCARTSSFEIDSIPFESRRSSSWLDRWPSSMPGTCFDRCLSFSLFFEILSPPQPRLRTRVLKRSENEVLHILRVLVSPMPYIDGSSRNPSTFPEVFDKADGQYDFVCSICLRWIKYSFNRITRNA